MSENKAEREGDGAWPVPPLDDEGIRLWQARAELRWDMQEWDTTDELMARAIQRIDDLTAERDELRAAVDRHALLIEAANDYRLSWQEWDKEGQSIDSSWYAGVSHTLHVLATIARTAQQSPSE